MELSIKISDLSNFSSNQTSRTLPNLKHLFVPAEGIQMLRSFALEAISQNPSEFWSLSGSTPKKNTALTEAFGYERIQIFNPEGRLRDSGQQDSCHSGCRDAGQRQAASEFPFVAKLGFRREI